MATLAQRFDFTRELNNNGNSATVARSRKQTEGSFRVPVNFYVFVSYWILILVCRWSNFRLFSLQIGTICKHLFICGAVASWGINVVNYLTKTQADCMSRFQMG